MQAPVHRPVQSRMKIEPKTYFANERTYLQWFNAATLLGSIALALVNVGGASRVVGILFLPVSVMLMCYALWAFHRRLRNIHERLPYGTCLGSGSCIILLRSHQHTHRLPRPVRSHRAHRGDRRGLLHLGLLLHLRPHDHQALKGPVVSSVCAEKTINHYLACELRVLRRSQEAEVGQ